MISEVEQKELKQLIGQHYSVEVQELLESKSIKIGRASCRERV